MLLLRHTSVGYSRTLCVVKHVYFTRFYLVVEVISV